MKMPSKNGNAVMSWIINSPFWGVLGKRMAVITVRGRKTGNAISVPISVSQDGKFFWVISSRERTWWRNLRDGAFADLRNKGKTLKVKGEVFESIEDVKVKLTEYLTRDSFAVKFLQVRVSPDGKLNDEDLSHLVEERVVIKLHKMD